MLDIDKILQFGKEFSTPGLAYVPLVLLCVWFTRQLIELRRFNRSQEHVTLTEMLQLVKELESLKQAGVGADALYALKQRILAREQTLITPTLAPWWNDFLSWRKLLAAFSGAGCATLLKVLIICIALYKPADKGHEDGYDGHITYEISETESVIGRPSQIYGNLRIWLQAIVVSIVCAIATIAAMRGSEQKPRVYFGGGFAAGLILPYLILALQHLGPALLHG